METFLTVCSIGQYSNCVTSVLGRAREGGLVWRGCSAGCDAEDGATGALTDGNANPGDKVPNYQIYKLRLRKNLFTAPLVAPGYNQ